MAGLSIDCFGMIESALIIKEDKCCHHHLDSFFKLNLTICNIIWKSPAYLTPRNTEGKSKIKVLKGLIYYRDAKGLDPFLFWIILYLYEPQSLKPIFHQPISTHSVQLYIQTIFFTCLSLTSVSWDQFSHNPFFQNLNYRNSWAKTSFPQVGHRLPLQ